MTKRTYAPNTAFTQKWTVENDSTRGSAYLLYQISSAVITTQLHYWLAIQGQTIQPGQAADVSIGITVLPGDGVYWASWRLVKDGSVIPLEAGADEIRSGLISVACFR